MTLTYFSRSQCDNFIFHAPIYRQFEPWMSFNMNDLDLHFTYCFKSQWMEIMPVPTCCKLHAHNYTCIPKTFRVAGDPRPYWSACDFLDFRGKYCMAYVPLFYRIYIFLFYHINYTQRAVYDDLWHPTIIIYGPLKVNSLYDIKLCPPVLLHIYFLILSYKLHTEGCIWWFVAPYNNHILICGKLNIKNK